MAEVIVTQTPPPTDVGGVMSSLMAPVRFLLSNWQFFLILIFVIILLTVLIVWWINREEEKKEMEDMLYREYKDTIRTAKKNQDATMYIKKYSYWNILLCLGLPLIKKKVGRKIYDHRQNFIGYYDGQFTDMLGNINILMWKDKYFLFFKDHFVMRLPQKAYTSRKEVDKKIKVPEGSEPKFMTVINWRPMPDGLLTKHDDKTQSIKMINHIKRGFYYYPIYTDEKMNMVDLTETINTLNLVNSSNILLENVIKESGKNVIGMAKTNTQLVYEQRKPEKVREVEKDDQEN